MYVFYAVAALCARSSQMLFSISQKLIQHQILNYTEILKWLREILICHIQFLQKHRDYANVGSNIPICRQAHIKLEVVASVCLILGFIVSIVCMCGSVGWSLGFSALTSGVLGGIRGYTAYTNLRGFFDSVYSPQ